MRSLSYICLLAILVMGLSFTAGCTFSRNTAPAPVTTAPPLMTSSPASVPPVQATSATTTVKTGVVDTTISIRFNDYDCLDVQQDLGVVYLNPEQKYTIRVSPPNVPASVNILLLDIGDRERLQASLPVWNAITKTWDYEGIVPLLQINDVSTTQEKTVTIQKQGKYYLCADDRKESGLNEAIIRVPVKMTRVG
jgi:hypothetical protein